MASINQYLRSNFNEWSWLQPTRTGSSPESSDVVGGDKVSLAKKGEELKIKILESEIQTYEDSKSSMKKELELLKNHSGAHVEVKQCNGDMQEVSKSSRSQGLSDGMKSFDVALGRMKKELHVLKSSLFKNIEENVENLSVDEMKEINTGLDKTLKGVNDQKTLSKVAMVDRLLESYGDKGNDETEDVLRSLNNSVSKDRLKAKSIEQDRLETFLDDLRRSERENEVWFLGHLTDAQRRA